MTAVIVKPAPMDRQCGAHLAESPRHHRVDRHQHAGRGEHGERVDVAAELAGGMAVVDRVGADRDRHERGRGHLVGSGADGEEHHPGDDREDRRDRHGVELVTEQDDAADPGEERPASPGDRIGQREVAALVGEGQAGEVWHVDGAGHGGVAPTGRGDAAGDSEDERTDHGGDGELAPEGDERRRTALGDEVPAGVQHGRGECHERGDEHGGQACTYGQRGIFGGRVPGWSRCS